jgi:tartrate dehydratase beta subunit/fumarate hydratase class I family protein
MADGDATLQEEKTRAEIAKLKLEAEKLEAENRVRASALVSKMLAETGKLSAETENLQKESRWYLLVIGSAATLAIVAIVKLFL